MENLANLDAIDPYVWCWSLNFAPLLILLDRYIDINPGEQNFLAPPLFQLGLGNKSEPENPNRIRSDKTGSGRVRIL